MIKNWFFYLLTLAGAVVFHAFYFGWYSWFLLLLALCLPVFSLLVSILAMVRIRLELDVPAVCRRGEPAYATMRATNGFLPMPRCRLVLVIRTVMTGREIRLRQETPGHDSWYVPLDTGHCGAIQCRLEKARVYDYMGLFSLPVRKPQAASLLVRPTAVQPERLPNLHQFLARQKKPKPGGGFSEEHELRDYRPGDSMRDIHWKLSVKTDRTIVREAQEPVRGKVLLTFDLHGAQSRIDQVLAQVLWLSRWLLTHDTPHQLVWIDPTDFQLTAVTLDTEQGLQETMDRLLCTPLREDTPSIAQRRFPGASWRCHVEG